MPKETRVNGRTKTITQHDSEPMRSKATGSRKPKLGQHFLVDRDAARTIVDALGDISKEVVIEIGPGRGAITELLIPRAAHLIAIEVDHVLAAQMRLKYARFPNVEVVEADFLRT